MDFSGMGISLISCIFIIVVPPIPVATIFLVIYAIRRLKRVPLTLTQSGILLAALYTIALILSCLYMNYAWWQYLTVM